MFFTTALFIGIGLTFWLVPRFHYDVDSRCATLMKRVGRDRYEDLAEFLDEYTLDGDPQFWEASGRVLGLLHSFRQALIHFGLVQALRRAEKVSPADAWFVWSRTGFQLWYTIRALLSHLLIGWFAPYPHASAFFAWSFHRQILLRMMVIADDDGCPLAIQGIADIL